MHSRPLSFWKVQDFIGIVDRHRGRLLLHLLLPRFKSVLEQLHLQGLTVCLEEGLWDERAGSHKKKRNPKSKRRDRKKSDPLDLWWASWGSAWCHIGVWGSRCCRRAHCPAGGSWSQGWGSTGREPSCCSAAWGWSQQRAPQSSQSSSAWNTKFNKVLSFFSLSIVHSKTTHFKKKNKKKTYLISLLQMASGVSNSPRNISEIRSAS